MSELQGKNTLMARSLQQKLDRLRLKPTVDTMSAFHSTACRSGPLAMSEEYNEKTERRQTEEFLNHARVHQEKLRRHITSLERETEANRSLRERKEDERAEKKVWIRDLKSEANAKFMELDRLAKRASKWRLEHEKVHKQLIALQETFSPGQIIEGSRISSSLDGMRRNIGRLLQQNKELTSQNIYMSKELHLCEVKLRGFREQLSRSRGTVPVDDVDMQQFEGGDETADICSLYYKRYSVECAEVALEKNRCLNFLGRNFYENWRQAHKMYALSEALQHMSSLRDLNAAVRFLMSTIKKLCECDRASYWVMDKARGVAWTKVPSLKNNVNENDEKQPQAGAGLMTTLTVPIDTGLVGAAFKSGETLNIADAYADARFNRSVDLQTDYRTRSVLCFPIVLEGQVLGVTQCINKVSANSVVFSESDLGIVKTLGSAMLPVLASCQAHEQDRKLELRRAVLVEAADEMARHLSHNRKDFLIILREKMKKMFRANDCCLVVVYKDFYTKIKILEIDGSLGHISADRTVESGGLVHSCATSEEPIHVFGKASLRSAVPPSQVDLYDILRSEGESSQNNPNQDVSVHTWPVRSPLTREVSAVIQWVCVDRSVIAFGDDGSFNEKNSQHLDLVSRMVELVGFFVEKFWPSKFRLTWTKAKHLQLKVRGMISFSSAKETGGSRFAAPPKNAKIIALWQRAKAEVLLRKRLSVQDVSPKEEEQQTTSKTSCPKVFMQKMVKERNNLPRRKTVAISPSSLEELRAIAEAEVSPFSKQRMQSQEGSE